MHPQRGRPLLLRGKVGPQRRHRSRPLARARRALDLEREAFVSLAGEPKSQERMAYMLKKDKPLRN